MGTIIVARNVVKMYYMFTIYGNIFYSASMKNNVEFSQKNKIELPSDAVVLLLGIYINKIKTLIQKAMYIYIHCNIIYKQPTKIWNMWLFNNSIMN